MSAAQPRTQSQLLVPQTRRRQQRQATLNSFFTAPPLSPPPAPALTCDSPIPSDVLTPSYTTIQVERVRDPIAAAGTGQDRTIVTLDALELDLPPQPSAFTFAPHLFTLSIDPSSHMLQTATYSAASGLPSPPLSSSASQSQLELEHSAQQLGAPAPIAPADATPTTSATMVTSAQDSALTDDALPTFQVRSPSERGESQNGYPRKRLRRSFTPPLPSSRPRTRASLRAAARSPSPPAAVAVVPVVSPDRVPKLTLGSKPSRLNRARNAARRAVAASNSTTPAAAKVIVVDDVDSDDVALIDIPESIDSSPAGVDASSDESVLERVEPRCTQRRVKVVKPVPAPNPSTQKKRPLHPFFSAAVAAVSTSRDRLKVPRMHRPVCDAWCYPGATVHVNAAPPLPLSPSSKSNAACRAIPKTNYSSTSPPKFPVVGVKFCHLVSQMGSASELQARPRSEIKEGVDESGLWTERYKADARLDSINAPLAADLCDWLRSWYEKRGLEDAGAGSGSEASIMSELDEDGFLASEKETIAIITGPVGCGKSTLVGTAARTMGLSILEINSSVCRTGRRVRDIVGEALTSHRVGGALKGGSATAASSVTGLGDGINPKSQSKVSLAKTLILFEEVDELQADEKGFWASVLELASSSDCKRPIICTANSFTSTMRQFFLEKRAVVRTDFDRLLVNSKEEPLLNTVMFKHVAFPDTRSERQTSSVLQRVALTEGIGAHRHLCDGLSVMHRYDTRRAINQLQFWGRGGIGRLNDRLHGGEKSTKTVTLTESQLQVGMDFIRSGVEHSIGPSVFTSGATNFCTKHVSKGKSPPNEGRDDDSLETLNSWAESLEAISECDVLGGLQVRQMQLRNAEARLPAEAINLDADIIQSTQISEDLMAQALEVSRPRLTFFRTNTYVRDVALHTSRLSLDHTTERAVMPMLPLARHPVVTDIIPVLISMVRAEDDRKSKVQNGKSAPPVPIRRTRLRSRQCGLSALDLDVATLTVLRKASIAPR